MPRKNTKSNLTKWPQCLWINFPNQDLLQLKKNFRESSLTQILGTDCKKCRINCIIWLNMGSYHQEKPKVLMWLSIIRIGPIICLMLREWLLVECQCLFLNTFEESISLGTPKIAMRMETYALWLTWKIPYSLAEKGNKNYIVTILAIQVG